GGGPPTSCGGRRGPDPAARTRPLGRDGPRRHARGGGVMATTASAPDRQRSASSRGTTAAGHAPTLRVLALLRGHTGRVGVAVAAGVAAELGALALMATAAWLIARAAQQPPLAALSLAIVGVRAFATTRGVFRYAERLAGHDAALRALAALRARVFDALVPLAPSGLPAYRSA